jgi:hypothetical protein
MPNTKHKANNPTVIEIHEEWAIKNGYAQARKPTSVQAHKPTKAQADKPASAQASSGSRINKR